MLGVKACSKCARIHANTYHYTQGEPLRTKRSGVRVPCSAPRKKESQKRFLFCLQTNWDSNPERVSDVKKTVRQTVFRREVRGGYCRGAAVDEHARRRSRLSPLQRANRNPLLIKGLRSFLCSTFPPKKHAFLTNF